MRKQTDRSPVRAEQMPRRRGARSRGRRRKLGLWLMLGYTAGLTASAAAYHTAGGYWDPSEMEYIVSRQRDLQVQLELNSTISATLDEYMELAQKNRHVEGYFELQALMTFRVLAASQNEMGIHGGVAEIGVHHGMSFVPLCLLNADAGDQQSIALAMDVFEHQDLNHDGSGAGNREQFEANVERWCGKHNMAADRLRVITADSVRVTAHDVLRETHGARIRFFSVDGSHTEEATHADMMTAAGSLVPGGIIAVDDYFAEGFPGVADGVQRFYHQQGAAVSPASATRGENACAQKQLAGKGVQTQEQDGNWPGACGGIGGVFEGALSEASGGQRSDASQVVPFLLGYNKVYFTHREFCAEYQEAVMSRLASIGDGRLLVRTTVMLGHNVVVLAEKAFCYRPR